MRGHNKAQQVMNIRPRFPLSVRKLSIGRQVMFRTKRLREHYDVCQVSLEIRELINQHSKDLT